MSPNPRPNGRLGAGWSSPVARQAHNLKVTGSNPVPATTAIELQTPPFGAALSFVTQVSRSPTFAQRLGLRTMLAARVNRYALDERGQDLRSFVADRLDI